ncbi:MAG: monooxygenase [Alphaproteobacteria bacterium]|nr:monooxygenase [Alphaproteobacteria bacterium]
MSVRPLLPLTLLALVACEGAAPTTVTYHQDAKAVLDSKCATCHQSGDIAPFPLTTYEEVKQFAAPVRAAIANGTMPPWMPTHDCNTYTNDYDLSDDDKALLLSWLDDGLAEGTPTDDGPAAVAVDDPFVADLTLKLPEAYTPTIEPDDYRCQIIPWPMDHTAYITGVRVEPDQRQMVHHTILFAASAAQAASYAAADAADPGPGYTCFGGPQGTSSAGTIDMDRITDLLQNGGLSSDGGSLAGGMRWVGSWVPGAAAVPFPEGTGLKMEPGDILIAQFHYNTLSASPVADQSSIEVMVADTVESPAWVLPFTNPGWITGLELLGGAMTIPAGESYVMHETSSGPGDLMISAARRSLGLPEDATFLVHNVGHHMHQLGTSGFIDIQHGDGSNTCLLDIPDWDFGWQGGYQLTEPVTVGPDDTIHMRCTWDNSAENQPIVDGQALPTKDVEWGEGTTDEMCLGVLYVTAP